MSSEEKTTTTVIEDIVDVRNNADIEVTESRDDPSDMMQGSAVVLPVDGSMEELAIASPIAPPQVKPAGCLLLEAAIRQDIVRKPSQHILTYKPPMLAKGTTMVLDNIELSKAKGYDPGSSIITFKNLSVTAKKAEQGGEMQTIGSMVRHPLKRAKRVRSDILSGMTGLLKPYTMVLLVGAPGSGKSTFLRTLAYGGKLPDSALKVTGDILLNGVPPDSTYTRRVSYVEQEDLLFPTLTVKESVMFSARCRLPGEIADEDVVARVDLVLKVLSLSHVSDTIIGNQELRGVSGGERRRVSIACEAVTSSSVLLLDAPSNGLDASSTLDVVKGARAMCNAGYTVAMSLLQPSLEAFNMFDGIIMLERGRAAYMGPRIYVMEWFQKLGYQCPRHLNTADFLQYVLERSGKEFYVGKTRPPLKGPEFVEAFETSALAKTIQGFVEVAEKESKDIPPPTLDLTNPYATSIARQTWLCLVRAEKLFYRNKALWIAGIFQSLLMGFILGTVFVQLPPTFIGGQNTISVIFFSIVFLGLSSMATIPLVYRDRPVFYIQQSRHYYRSISWFSGLLVTQLPQYFFETVLYSTIMYWSCGFSAANNGQRFLTFIFALFLSKCTANAFMQTVAYALPTQMLAGVIVPAVLALSLLFCGFFVPRTMIPDPWIWMYYISFFRYPVEALSINQLYDREPYGPSVLQQFGMQTGQQWVWNYIGVLILFWVFFETTLLVVMSFVRFSKASSSASPIDETDDHTTSVHDGSTTGDGSKKVVPDDLVTVDTLAYSEATAAVPKVMLTFKDLVYSVSVPTEDKKGTVRKVLLNKVTGYVQSGMMIALMGASGAGKSTLLDVLANRKTGGTIDGEVLLNGKPKDKFFNRIAGYVEQFDLLHSSNTVRESIVFSALLRLPQEMSHEEKIRVADDVLVKLDLVPAKDILIGDPESGGASLELRKRTTIGIELAARPSLLFLDEPTTGLDAVAAMLIMRSVKKLTEYGQAVICTIHQPSSDLFALFGHLLLLRKGGETAYFGHIGEHCATLLSFYEKQGFHWSPHMNPADFVLQIVQGRLKSSVYGDNYDSALAYRESPRCEQALQELQELSKTGPGSDGTDLFNYKHKYATNVNYQIKVVTKRAFVAIWRRPEIFRAIILRAVVMSLIGGTLWWNNRANNQTSGRMRIGLLFFSLIFTAIAEVGRIPDIVADRSVFYREDSQGAYRPMVAFFAWVSSYFPLLIFGTFLFNTVLYWLAGLNGTDAGQRYGFFLLIEWMWALIFQSFVMMISLGLPSAEVASSAAPALNSIFSLFAGFMIPKTSIPKPWIWMYYLSPYAYPIDALSSNELYGLNLDCTTQQEATGQCVQPPPPGGNQLMEIYGFSWDFKW
eukprot:CAMPEP_0184676120 /NCGR_PEP_ID=MMETSP0308-20130426/88116_1 /TAXON_ID=38269 /ORGANISM="Gloeochaete witrockiana, Strain SAG 46.84" /LENGTH=1364 /DNA_ID=CAMNT_0027123931 /DNA_START=56 /DNA_END=4147 /DNA_ORIENTATION=-